MNSDTSAKGAGWSDADRFVPYLSFVGDKNLVSVKPKFINLIFRVTYLLFIVYFLKEISHGNLAFDVLYENLSKLKIDVKAIVYPIVSFSMARLSIILVAVVFSLLVILIYYFISNKYIVQILKKLEMSAYLSSVFCFIIIYYGTIKYIVPNFLFDNFIINFLSAGFSIKIFIAQLTISIMCSLIFSYCLSIAIFYFKREAIVEDDFVFKFKNKIVFLFFVVLLIFSYVIVVISD